MSFDEEIRKATLKNLTAKSKIMAFIFTGILFIQVGFLCYTLIQQPDFYQKMPAFAPYASFGLILGAFCVEWFTYLYLKRNLEKGNPVKNHVPYFITIMEISFPSIIIAFAGYIVVAWGMPLTTQLLSSPPAIMYFIMIILSSLMLDRRLCFISGIVAGVEYLIISLIIVQHSEHVAIDIANQVARSAFLILAGLIAGYVSSKIREAMLDSFRSRDALISKLDQLVNEKTAQIQEQKSELEEKQKEIIDSIHYARRIQQALMPTPRNIKKAIDRLTKD